MSIERARIRFEADVLVIGGGPAGTWAALGARAHGAERVILVDKGYCGSSGATASANTGVWTVREEERERAIDQRYRASGGLASKAWMASVLETTSERLEQLSAWGYPFPREDGGQLYRANLRGPDYMGFMRRQVRSAGVRVLDHSPALELLTADGAVVGAAGYRLQEELGYEVRARAVVIASGGVAFLSKTLGCDVDTGDGLLMAAEVGADLSGMEFSAQYGICPTYSSVTKGLPYLWATFSDEAGNVIPHEGNRMLAVGRGLVKGPVYAVLDQATPEEQRWLRDGQPNCFLPHDRTGIDPFRQRFPVTLRCEGTIRGTGGIRILSRDGTTQVPGLYAAGDAASRERFIGAVTGGGAPNAAWAISSGSWSGEAAARYAAAQGSAQPDAQGAGRVGLRPTRAARGGAEPYLQAARGEALPLDKNLFRSEPQLHASLAVLDAAWNDASAHLHGQGRSLVRAREAAALLACARFAYRSALARRESRGLHRRLDLPELDPAQTHTLASRGLDDVRVTPYPFAPGD